MRSHILYLIPFLIIALILTSYSSPVHANSLDDFIAFSRALGETGIKNLLGIPKSGDESKPYAWENTYPGDQNSAFGFGFEVFTYLLSAEFLESYAGFPNVCKVLKLDCDYSWYTVKKEREAKNARVRQICRHGEKKDDVDSELDDDYDISNSSLTSPSQQEPDSDRFDSIAKHIRQNDGGSCALACYNRARNPIYCHSLVVEKTCDKTNSTHVLDCAWSCGFCDAYEDMIVAAYMKRAQTDRDGKDGKTKKDGEVNAEGLEEDLIQSLEHCEDIVDSSKCQKVMTADRYLRMLPIFRHSPQSFINTLSFSSMCRKTAEMCFQDDLYDPQTVAKQIFSFCKSRDSLKVDNVERNRMCGGNLFENGEYERLISFSLNDKEAYSHHGLEGGAFLPKQPLPPTKRRSSRLRVPKADLNLMDTVKKNLDEIDSLFDDSKRRRRDRSELYGKDYVEEDLEEEKRRIGRRTIRK